MTPAWTCFDWRPADLARNAYAGLMVDGQRLFPEGALADGNFEIIVSGQRKGVGSSRETAVQAEKWSGIRIAIAASFAPIHRAQQHQPGRAHGRPRDGRAPASGRDPRAVGVHARLGTH